MTHQITARTIENKKYLISSASKDKFSIYRYLNYFFPHNIPLRRLFHLTRYHNVQTIVVEEIHQSNDIKEDNLQLKIRTEKDSPRFLESRVYRYSFFRNNMPTRQKEEILRSTSKDFIGYIIIKENLFEDKVIAHVYESVIKPKKEPYLFFHTINTYNVKICGKEFKIKGCAFFQQNEKSTVCGHVSLSTFLSSRNPDEIISPHEINKLLNLDLTKTKFGPHKGLSEVRIEKALIEQGYKLYGFAIRKKSSEEVLSQFARVLYGSQESGYPALLGFKSKKNKGRVRDHLVTVIGHTFDQGSWVPSADEYYFKFRSVAFESSLSWTESFIIHDDNIGAYFSLPIHYIEPSNIRYFVGIRNKEIVYDPFEIEVIAQSLLKSFKDSFEASNYDLSQFEWMERLIHYIEIERIVLRTKLITNKEYIQYIKKASDWHGNPFNDDFKNHCKENLPEKFWLVEISFPYLFSTHKRKLGCILLNCYEKSSKEIAYRNLFLLARYPGYFDKEPKLRGDLHLKLSGIPGHIKTFV